MHTMHASRPRSKPAGQSRWSLNVEPKIEYTNYWPKGAIWNVDYIFSALRKFLQALCQKSPDLVPGEWVFH